MLGYQFDDGGRADAGYKGKAGDCVVRALCILTGADYRAVYRECAHAQGVLGDERGTPRNGVQNPVRDFLFREHGLVKVKIGRGVKPTWAEAYEAHGDCIVKTRKHVAAIVDGALRDTHDWRGYWWDPLMECVVGYDADDKPACGSGIRRGAGTMTVVPSDRAEWRIRKATSVWVVK